MNLPLFRRELVVSVLSSGSKGNCTYIGDERRGVLIDCGPSTKQIRARMEAAGLGSAEVEAVLITHEHSDHVGSAAILSRNLENRQGRVVPFLMTPGTRAGLREACRPQEVREIQAGEVYSLGGVEAEAFSVPHDTREPVAWRVRVGGLWAGVITDLGRMTPLVVERLRSLTVAVLEFNHDEGMLLDGPYPWELKQRIRGNKGHLSNTQAAELLKEGLSPNLRQLVLAHLSEENNTPAHAGAAAGRVLQEAGALGNVGLQIGRQDEALAPIRLQGSDW
jgi:phosphoribosyl 1,2-cyclic phosphodiesterase